MSVPVAKFQDLEIGAELGRGAFSTVYSAVHRGEPCAVKIALPGTAEEREAQQRRFRLEASTLVRLRHPNVVRVLAWGESEGRPYLVTELLTGGSLASLLEAGPLAEARLLRLAKDLSSGLAALHRRGLVHRDVKPENVLLDVQGNAKLIDLGLVTSEGQRVNNAAVGTFLYTAPEQAGMLAIDVDERADLYSLGAVLYECATGEPPYSGSTVAELLNAHATAPIPSLVKRAPAASPRLEALVQRLLSKDPADRFAHAEDVTVELVHLLEAGSEERKRDLSPLTPPRHRGFQPRSTAPLVGRHAALRALREHSAGVGKDGGRVVLLRGEGGVGKSRLVSELLSSLRGGWLVGRCDPVGAAPFAALRQVVDSHLRFLSSLPEVERAQGEKQLRDSLGDLAPVLRGFSPPLRNVLAVSPHAGSSTGGPELLFGALSVLLLGLAKNDEVRVLVLEDCQWVDGATLAVLRELLTLVKDAPLLVVLVERTGGEGLDVAAALAGPAAQRLSILPVEPLSESELTELVSAELGGVPLDGATVAKVIQSARGNPLFVRELLQSMIDAGHLMLAWDRWHVDPTAFDGVGLSHDVQGLMQQRLGLISPPTRTVLRGAAAMGGLFDVPLLVQVLGLEPGAVREALEEAAGASIVRRDAAGRFEFAHDSLRSPLLDALPAAERASLHGRIANVLHAQLASGEGAPSQLYAAARHYLRAPPGESPQRAYDLLVEAGCRACEEFAFPEAARFLAGALQAAERGGFPVALNALEHLGEARVQLGQLDDALRRLREAHALARTPVDVSRVCHRLAAAHLSAMQTAEAWEWLAKGFRALGSRAPALEFGSVVRMLWDWAVGAFIQKTGLGFASSRGTDLDRRRMLVRLYQMAGNLGVFESKDLIGLQVGMNIYHQAQRIGPGPELAQAHGDYAYICGELGLQKQAYASARRSIEMAEGQGNHALVARTMMLLAIVQSKVGSILESSQTFQKLRERFTRWMPPFERFVAMSVPGFYAMMRGHVNEAVTLARELLEYQRQRTLRGQQVHEYGGSNLALAALAVLGARDEAAAQLAIAEEKARATPPGERSQRSDLLGFKLLYLLETDALGARCDEVIAEFRALGWKPDRIDLFLRHFYVAQAYVQLARLSREPPGENLEQRKVAAQAALRDLAAAASTPVFRAHLDVARGQWALLEKKPQAALQHAAAAAELSGATDSPWTLFEAHRLRALGWHALGNEASSIRFGLEALRIAEDEGWVGRAARFRKEFPYPGALRSRRQSQGQTDEAAVTRATSALSTRFNRQLEALLEVGLASAQQVDPDDVARLAIDALVKVLRAERAFLFLAKNEGDSSVTLKVGRDREGHSLAELKGYSSTVVERVRVSGEALIVSGTEEGASIGSASAVANDLRSIIAAPMKLRGTVLGVLYLDSRVARGIFSDDDVAILTVIANHIAIALETAVVAQREAERQAMAKDLALTRAVQTLLLPKSDHALPHGMTLRSFYRSATQSGGDWWWYQILPDGRVWLMMGDVIGHGAGAAMVSAAVVGALRSLLSGAACPSPEQLLQTLSQLLCQMSDGQQTMTASLMELEPRSDRLRLWSAAAPPPLVCGPNGRLEFLSTKGTVMGGAALQLGTAETRFGPGDCLLLCSDGLVELPHRGRPLGLRRLQHAFTSGLTESMEAATLRLEALVSDAEEAGGVPDDVTFVAMARG